MFIRIMNECDTSFYVTHPCAKYGKPMSIQKKLMDRTRKPVKNPINLTLRIMNVPDTSYYGYTPMC